MMLETFENPVNARRASLIESVTSGCCTCDDISACNRPQGLFPILPRVLRPCRMRLAVANGIISLVQTPKEKAGFKFNAETYACCSTAC